MEMPHVCPVRPARRADICYLRRFVYVLETIIALRAMLHAQLARLDQPLTRLCLLNFVHVIPDITVRRGTLLVHLVRSAPLQVFLHILRAIALGTTPVVRGAFHAL